MENTKGLADRSLCIWLEDKESTATEFRTVLQLAGVAMSLSGSPEEFVGDLNGLKQRLADDKGRLLIMIDLKVYGPLPDVDGEEVTDDTVDLGFQVIERFVCHEAYGVRDAPRVILTEREKDEALVATATTYGVAEDRIFQKYVESELYRFRHYINQVWAR